MISAGIIGYGYWGPNLVRNIWANPEINLFAVCDKNVKRLAELKRQYPSVDTITDCGQIIKSPDIQAVMIATPVPTHYEMAKKSLLAGKHTFIETHGTFHAECEELIELAEEKKLTLMTGHTFIYSPVVRKSGKSSTQVSRGYSVYQFPPVESGNCTERYQRSRIWLLMIFPLFYIC